MANRPQIAYVSGRAVEIDPEHVRARLKAARVEAGLSQRQLADLLEVHENTIQNYEAGRVPTHERLAPLARVLNRPVEWILWGDDAVTQSGQSEAVHQALTGLTAGLTNVQELLREIKERLDRLESR